MGKSKQQQVDEFVDNAERGDHAKNDEIVKDFDKRDETPVIIDAEK